MAVPDTGFPMFQVGFCNKVNLKKHSGHHQYILYICICMYVYKCVNIYIYAYSHMFFFGYFDVFYVSICLCLYMRVLMFMQTCKKARMYARVHVCKGACMQVYIYIYVCVYVYVCMLTDPSLVII